MDDGMGGTAQELTPIMCLCALYEVAKTAPLNFEGHAKCEAAFNRALKALEEAQNVKSKPKKSAKTGPPKRKPSPKRRRK